MNYEINVSMNGKHFFATHPRSITTKDQAAEVYAELDRAFPYSGGWKITVSYHREVGEDVTEQIRDEVFGKGDVDEYWGDPTVKSQAEELAEIKAAFRVRH